MAPRQMAALCCRGYASLSGLIFTAAAVTTVAGLAGQQAQSFAMDQEFGGSNPSTTAGGASALAQAAIAVRVRMAGPGGYYNLGNTLGLVVGLALQLAAPHPSLAGRSVASVLLAYFAGSGAAVALTLATLVFLWGGEVYHRAWSRPGPPDRRLNRGGDILSGFGAIGLGVALFLLGQHLLAATAGLLHALGKFGSAAQRPDTALPRAVRFPWPEGWPDLFRCAVVASRVPAILAAGLSTAAALPAAWSGASPLAVAEPLTLLVCSMLWVRADLLLFRG